MELASITERFLALCIVALDDLPDLLSGIKKVADRAVMVEGIDDVSEILAHAAAGVPGAVLKFGLLVDEVGRDDLVHTQDRVYPLCWHSCRI